MPKWCVVPRCKSGCKTLKEKCSKFKVPSNVEMRKKWEVAIPGVVNLKPSQFVCEKHFEQRFVVRKWIKYGATGQIIAESAYAYPRLDATAVPSIFDSSMGSLQNYSQNCTQDANIGTISSINKLASKQDCSSSKLSLMDYCPAVSKVMSMDQDFHKIGSINDQKPLVMHDAGENIHRNIKEEINPQMKVTGTESTVNLETQNYSAILSEDKESLCMDFKDEVLVKVEMEADNSTLDKSEFVSSDCSTGITASSSIEKKLPVFTKSWVVTEIPAGEGQMFSLIVTRTENDEKFPVIERSVTLQVDKILRYRVYGRSINAQEFKLPRAMDCTKQLQESLERFKNMGLCIGLGTINIHHLLPDVAFKDSVDRWHANKCTLMTKTKRCDHCMKMRQLILKRGWRSKKNRTLTLVSRASNPIELKKLIALRKKNLRVRHAKKKAQQGVYLPQQTLNVKQKRLL